jgi:hypothetical protein
MGYYFPRFFVGGSMLKTAQVLEDGGKRELVWSGITIGQIGLGILVSRKRRMIEDGFGNVWYKRCPRCQRETMVVVRPGSVQCSNCG